MYIIMLFIRELPWYIVNLYFGDKNYRVACACVIMHTVRILPRYLHISCQRYIFEQLPPPPPSSGSKLQWCFVRELSSLQRVYYIVLFTWRLSGGAYIFKQLPPIPHPQVKITVVFAHELSCIRCL